MRGQDSRQNGFPGLGGLDGRERAGPPWPSSRIPGTLTRLVAGNFNGDGRADLAGLNSAGHIYYTTNRSTWNRIPGTLARLAAGNFNGDLYADLAGVNSAGNIYYSTSLSTWTPIPGRLTWLAGDTD